ncbi:hypothetical protein K438DRAFT_1776133 [Mycena galopus ATCC 62051]|nr:hypothetical protein K438DRAFT_1776133 [Mycena galopus ATCC 62051]
MYPRCILVSVPGIAALPRPRGPRRRCVYRAPSCSDVSQSDLRACTPASTPPLSSLSDVSRARPPFLYATAAALLLYDPTVTMRHPTLLVATAHQRPPPFRSTYSAFSCPFPKDPASFLQTKIIIVLAIHPTDSYPRHNLHATELLEGSSTSLVPCPYHHDARTDRHEATTSFLEELSVLGTGGDATHLRRARNLWLCGARARFLGIALTGPLRGLGLGDPSESGNGNKVHTPACPPLPDNLYFHNGFVAAQPPRNARERAHLGRPRLPPSSFEALLNAQRLNTHSTPPVRQRHPPYPSRPQQRTVRAPNNRRTRPPRAEPTLRRLHPSPHHVISIHVSIFCMARLQRRASAPVTLLPSSNDSSPTPSASPRASYNSSWKPSKRAQSTHAAYTELVASATPTTSRPHPPPRSRPRHAPGHHDHATQALAKRRARPISMSIRFFGDWFLHTPARNARPAHLPRLPNGDSTPIHAILCFRNVFTYCCHSAQSSLSAALDGNPQGIPHRNCPHSESHYQLSMSHAPPSLI